MIFVSLLLLAPLIAANSHDLAQRHAGVALDKRATSKAFKLVQNWHGSNFWQGFRFFNADDPTHGAVDYVPASTAVSRKIAYITSKGTAVIKVDSNSVLKPGELRKSVRITSKKNIGFGSLLVADFAKVPYGDGVWPAFWTVGDDWPNQGEIDILENVNDERQNHFTLHTAAGCYMTTPLNATGSPLQTNCDAAVNYNAGCGILDPSPATFGSALNKAGGGVFATYYGEDEIAIWHFPRKAIPADLKSNRPDISKWPRPQARWTNKSCDIKRFFKPQTIVINITLCGDGAGNDAVWAKTGRPGRCVDAVVDPKNYVNALFEINYVKVFGRA